MGYASREGARGREYMQREADISSHPNPPEGEGTYVMKT